MFLPLVLLSLVLAVSAGEIKCVVREREALVKFGQGLTDNYGALSSWGSEEECCNWEGIRCSNTTGHVTGILLRGIGGNISSSLLELQFLEHLELSNSYFGGIPIPRFLGSFENLRILNLRWSNFFGMVPPQLGNLTNLRILDLGYNDFTWSENLEWLSHLTLLSELYLSRVNISDSNWLYSVLKLRSLQQLSLSICYLKDATPSSDLFLNSSLLQSLSSLDLSHNMLTSSTFDWLFNLSTTLTSIKLDNNLLEGPIPDSFGRFIFLKELHLYANELTGPGEVPKSLGSLSRLKFLGLGSNKLTGPIHSSLGNLSELEWLDFSLNNFEGIVSESHFLKLQRLKYLYLSGNSLTLQISPSWIPPFQLDTITLGSCNMGPSFPTWLQTQTNISSLDISNASISGNVPQWLWSLSPNMRHLEISNNQFLGPIPDLSFSPINKILASYNQFSGRIPLFNPNTWVVQLNNNLFSDSISSICSISYNSLIQLDLSYNQLVGTLPDCWRNMTQLMILNLSNNKLSGEIPELLDFLSNLKVLHLRGNNLSGDLPSGLKMCESLQLLDIGENNLTGEIPPWLSSSFFSSMIYISLRGNRFHGKIPSEICSLNQVQLLDLSRNNISGEIPHCFQNFTSLVNKSIAADKSVGMAGYYDIAVVQWKRQEAVYFRLSLLKLIDLSSNKLVGNIPTSFSTLRGLISLNLSRNHLSGSIDSHIGQMEMLEVLDLSRNELSGEIPIGLAQLHSLAVLDLADNKLSGKIPSGTQLQTFNESAYSGNDRLCGKPLKQCEADKDKGAKNRDEEEDGGSTRLSFIQEIGISIAFGFILGFWGVVGSFIVKKSWRDAFFASLDSAANWMYVSTILVLTKFKRRMN